MIGWQEPIVAGSFQAAGTYRPEQWLLDVIGATPSDAGVRIDGYTALTSGPVWQAINIIAGDVGMLPLNIFRNLPEDKREMAKQHPAHRLMKIRPHPELSPSTFKETIQSWALLWGNGAAQIVRDDRGAPIALTPLDPRYLTLDRDDTGQLWYTYRENGITPIPLFPDEVFHIRGLGDALWGHSVINLAKNAVGFNLALEKHGNRTFRNNARPSGILEIPGRLDPENRAQLRREWEDMHKGTDNAGRIALLQGGMSFKPTSISNEDAQWLEAMRFSREEIASWFNLPAHKLNALERATFSNIEEQNRNYLNMTLARWLVRWQEETERKLFSKRERNTFNYSARFNTGALLRGDLKSRYEAHAVGLNTGFLSVNDVRRTEDMDPIGPEGDVYLRPLNMQVMGEEVEEEEVEEEDIEEEDEEEEEENKIENTIRTNINKEMHRLIRHEIDSLQRAWAKPDKALAMEKVYNNWPNVMDRSLRPLVEVACVAKDVKPAYAITPILEYCEESKNRLLNLLVNEGDLADEIEYWPERASDLTSRLMEM